MVTAVTTIRRRPGAALGETLSNTEIVNLEKCLIEIKSLVLSVKADVDEIKVDFKESNKKMQSFEVWKADIEGRLREGAKSFNEIKVTLANKIDKKVVLAYIAGAAGGGAVLMKVLGKILGG